MIERPSPNFNPRGGVSIDMLVLHYTGMADCARALGWLCDPTSKVSAHYLIDQDGATYTMVPEAQRAWHAGVASWHGEDNINSRSIGIELVNPGHELGYQDFPERQMAALESLALDIVQRHDIAAPRVLAHSDVAPGRKQDPGEKFDWRRLAAAGIGLWPGDSFKSGKSGAGLGADPEAGNDLAPGDEGDRVALWQSHLAAFGYGVPGHGRFDDATKAVVTALQRHFRPGRVDGVADAETRGVLTHLLNMFGDS